MRARGDARKGADTLDTGDRSGERKAFRNALHDVGTNLPHDPVEVEGSDVNRVVRHKDNRETEPDDEIRGSLEDPHPDLPYHVVRSLDL